MTDPATVGEIIKQYEKHGWALRRALLSDDSLPSLSNSLNGIDIIASDLEALWFSRSSRPDSESWELRRLTGSPFALVAVIASNASEEERESTLAQVANDMRDRTFA
jgi:hypothetical protein